MTQLNECLSADIRHSMDWTWMGIDPASPMLAQPHLDAAATTAPERVPAPRPAREEILNHQTDAGPPVPTELEWSWGFRSEVLSVLAEDPLLLGGSELKTAELLLEEASREADLTRATDYDVELRLPTAWALRVRRFAYLRRFGSEIVLRASTGNGSPSEAEKVLTHANGPDRYLYAWVSADESRFIQWLVMDVPRLRRVWADPDRRTQLRAHTVNFDSGRHGLSFPVDALIATRVVVRALLAKPSFETLSQAEAFLSNCPALGSFSPQERRGVAIYLLKTAFDSSYYVGPAPL